MGADVKPPPPWRLPAEAVGTGLLVTLVVGSGIAAQRLSDDEGRSRAAVPRDRGQHARESHAPGIRSGERRAP